MSGSELRDTRRRIRSVQATEKITRAMGMIASSRIPKSVSRLSTSKSYIESMRELVRTVVSDATEKNHPLLDVHPLGRVGILVIASDRGLVGAYVSSVIKMAEARISEIVQTGREVSIFAVGRKAHAYFRYRGYTVEKVWIGLTDNPTYRDSRQVSSAILEQFELNRIRCLEVFYTQFRSALVQKPTHLELVPISVEEREGERGSSPIYEPPPDTMLGRLLRRYVDATVYDCLLESATSEHSARRRAMKAATDNAEDLIKGLGIQANRARQSEITSEIAEIVGGAEALAELRAERG